MTRHLRRLLGLTLIIGLVGLPVGPVAVSAAAPLDGGKGDTTELSAEADQLWQEGVILAQQGRLAEARERLAEALQRYQVLASRRGEGAALNQLGSVYQAMGQYGRARELYDQALAVVRELGDPAAEGVTLNNLGLAHQSLGQYDRALEFYEPALAIHRAVGNQWEEGTTLNNLGAVYQSLGQYDRALAFYEPALALRQAVGNRGGEATTLGNLGLVYRSLGQYGRALEFYEPALALHRELGNRGGEATILGNLGLVHQWLGQYGRALDCYEAALVIHRSLGDRAGEGITLNNLGGVYQSMGQYGRALELYDQALTFVRQVGDAAAEGTTLNNLGLTYQLLEQYDRAQEFFEQALGMRRAVGNRAGEGITLNNLGAVSRSRGQYDRAREFMEQALALHRELGNRREEGTVLNNLGTVYRSLAHYDRAREYLEWALEIRRAVGNRAGEGITLGNLGQVAESRGELGAALDYYEAAIAVSEDLRAQVTAEELRTSLAEQAAWIYERAARLRLRLGQPERAFALSERARARSFLDQLANGALDIRTGADAALIAEEQAQRAQLRALQGQLQQEQSRSPAQQNHTRIEALSAQLATQQRDYEQLLIRLKQQNPEYASLIAIDPLSLDQIQELLDERTTLLAYFVSDEATLVFVVTRQSFVAQELPVRRTDLRALVESGGFAQRRGSEAGLTTLSNALIAPIRAHLRTPLVGVLPHDVLQYVPFAALRAGARYLGEEYTLFTLPSGSSLPFIQAKRKARAADPTVLAMAQGLLTAGLPPLPHVDQEARAVAALFGGQPLTGPDATETRFREGAGDYRLLHVASHGEYNPHNPLFSRLVLGPSDEDDGVLEVHEIYGLDLARADLVVLSACETSVGARSRGDDVVGLNRAFMYAGTPTVVASLWNVDDRATAELMQAFYGQLRAGMGKAAALQAAQAEIRARYPHPYYWAPFVLTGDPG